MHSLHKLVTSSTKYVAIVIVNNNPFSFVFNIWVQKSQTVKIIFFYFDLKKHLFNVGYECNCPSGNLNKVQQVLWKLSGLGSKLLFKEILWYFDAALQTLQTLSGSCGWKKSCCGRYQIFLLSFSARLFWDIFSLKLFSRPTMIVLVYFFFNFMS